MQSYSKGKSISGVGRFNFAPLLILLAIAVPQILRASCSPPYLSVSYNVGAGFELNGGTFCLSSGTAWVEWGQDTSYGNTSPNFTIGESVQGFFYNPSFGVGPTTLMHFRAKGYDSGGTNATADQTFLTPGWAVITNQPQSQTVSVGDNVTFSVGIMSNPGLLPGQYQWYKGTNAISGATSSTLSLTNVQPADSGSYGVKAENNFEGGSFWQYSSPASLTVSSPILAFNLSGTNLVLSWPAAASSYFLESSAIFGTNNWTTVSSSMQTNASNITVTVPVTPSWQFFRLHHY